MTALAAPHPIRDLAAPWRTAALCAQTDPEEFFPEKGGSAYQAKKICMACDVRAACLAYALANREQHGVWGGLTRTERAHLNGDAADADDPQAAAHARIIQHAQPAEDGHSTWTGPRTATVCGRSMSPVRAAWLAAHGEEPQGHVRTECGRSGCVAADHLADDAVRARRHGTPASYARHLAVGTEPCAPCMEAREEELARRRMLRRQRDAARRTAALAGRAA